MIRLAIYITLAILLAVGAVWFADHPGNMIITWQGWEIRLSVAVFGLLALLYTIFCWYLFQLYRWFRSENPLTSPKRQQSRRQKGLAELDKGWAALAVHDREAAIRHGKKALGLLPDNNGPRRLLVKATEGKIRQKYLDQLSKDPDGHLLAMACKLDIALSEGDTQGSLALLNDIREKRPNNPWISQQLFDIQTRLGQWTAAAQELTKLAKAKAIDKVTEKHLSAVLAYSQALEADLAGQKKLAREQAELALKNDPAFIPAALLLGRYHLAQGDKGKARKVIEATWKLAPHPELGQFFLKLDPLESVSEKFRRVQKFTALNPDHLHSRHLLARVALDTEHWAEAKKALDYLISTKMATRETYHLLARLDMVQKKDEKAAQAHLAQAAEAAPDPKWCCTTCHTTRENYTALCPTCHTFGQVSWQG